MHVTATSSRPWLLWCALRDLIRRYAEDALQADAVVAAQQPRPPAWRHCIRNDGPKIAVRRRLQHLRCAKTLLRAYSTKPACPTLIALVAISLTRGHEDGRDIP